MTTYNFGDILLVPFPFTFGELQIIDFLSAGLIKISVIKPVISTIEKSLVIRKLDQLQDSDCQKLKNMIETILG